MDITIIVPYDEGMADVNGDISAGIRVYPGHLTVEQILKLTEESVYPERAVMVKRDEEGGLGFVSVTFSPTEGAKPVTAEDREMWYKNCEGAEFTEGCGFAVGKLSYEAHHSKMEVLDA